MKVQSFKMVLNYYQDYMLVLTVSGVIFCPAANSREDRLTEALDQVSLTLLHAFPRVSNFC